MNVAELQKYLSDFNPLAEVEVVVNNRPMSFELLFGSSEELKQLNMLAYTPANTN